MPARTRHRSRAEAYNLGAAGENAPEWVSDDSALLDAFEQGKADGDRPTSFHPPANKPEPKSRSPKLKTSAKTAPPRAATKAPAPAAQPPAPPAPAPATPAGPPSPTSTTEAGGRGTGGGVLLAILLYPLLMATVKYGPQGPLMWIQAKFLNKVTTPGTVH